MYKVIMMDLPPTIRSFVKRTDGYDVIVINARLSRAVQERAYKHELEHLANGDLDGGLSADRVEWERHEE